MVLHSRNTKGNPISNRNKSTAFRNRSGNTPLLRRTIDRAVVLRRRILILVTTALILYYIGIQKDYDISTSSQRNNENLKNNASRASYETIKQVQTTYMTPTTKNDANNVSKYNTDVDLMQMNEPSNHQPPMTCKGPRLYPPIKYYGLSTPLSQKPDFLTGDTLYIRGKNPFVLQPDLRKKMCIDTSLWENLSDNNDEYPFSDGQNPSVVSFSSTSYDLEDRVSAESIRPIEDYLESPGLHEIYGSVVYVGGAQCSFDMSDDQRKRYRFSSIPFGNPPTTRSLFLLLNKDFDTIFQGTIELLNDLPKWGKIKLQEGAKTIPKLDDPRLFFFRGELWVLYRNGEGFGFESQLHNKIHFDMVEDTTATTNKRKLNVYIKASETVTSCCGRNMSMLTHGSYNSNHQQDEHFLKTVTWVDPLSVQTVLDSSYVSNSSPGKLSQYIQIQKQENKKLRGRRKSDIHGTNGYMVPFGKDEYLGIAHFHRPEHRKKSPYALHGHHYTHAFYTISQNEPHVLKRLSNEFIFQALHSQVSEGKDDKVGDGEVIQFASGLDIVQRSVPDELGNLVTRNFVMISYGVNDCESVVALFSEETVQYLLLDIENGQQVVDVMMTEQSQIY